MIRVCDNDDDRFDGQTLIECVDDETGTVLWRSWAPADVDPAIRLNIDQPNAVDDRSDTDTTEVAYRVPTVAEAPAVGIVDADHHRVVATYAAVVEAVTVADAAAAAELPEQALVDEATAWGAFAS